MSETAATTGTERWVAALLVAAFAPAVLTLMGVWFTVDYYSHGLLVPFVAFWAAHQIGQGHRPFAPERERRAVPALAGSLALYAAGLAAGSPTLQGLAVVAVAAAGVLWFWGGPGLRALAFPVGFLLFMVPLPDAWLTPLIVQLQLLVSRAAGDLLALAGTPVVREGNVLILPGDVSLFVEEACSGITSIVALTPLAVMLGYLTERSMGRRLLIVAAVIPLAMLGNLVRVIATVLAARRFGVERATEGVVHDSAGLLTFALSCVLLIGFGLLLRRMAGGGVAPVR